MGVDPVVLGFAAMNGFHVQSVTENENDPFSSTEIGDPVPGEDAFDSDHDLIPIRSDRVEKGIRIGRHVAMKNDRTSRIECTDTWFERANQFRSNADVVACKISLSLLLIFVALRGTTSIFRMVDPSTKPAFKGEASISINTLQP